MKLNDLKIRLYTQGLNQVILAKMLKCDTTRVNLHINGVMPLPEKFIPELCKILKITREEHDEMIKSCRQAYLKG